ncbi:DUF302 domain-containing protein [bacterium]|nr:DUF302 domain-containing protein [bacterium]
MESYGVVVQVALAFERTLDAVRSALAEEEFAIISEIDLQQQVRETLGVQMRPYRILGVWLPTWEMQAIAHEPEIGVLLPSHVCIWEQADGTCCVATADLKHLAPAAEHPALAEVARAANARLRAVLAWVRTATWNNGPRATPPRTANQQGSS